jgi:hypothetical protein
MKYSIVSMASVVILSGCASIFNGQTQAVTINSNPEGAEFSVANRAGQKIHAGTTPVTLTLNRGAGYFKPEVYTIKFEKQGFVSKEVTVTGAMSGWYIGNIIFGGLIGMLAVDPVTGAMYALPASVNHAFEANAEKTSQSTESLKLVSTTSLTPEQMKLARLVTATE